MDFSDLSVLGVGEIAEIGGPSFSLPKGLPSPSHGSRVHSRVAQSFTSARLHQVLDSIPFECPPAPRCVFFGYDFLSRHFSPSVFVHVFFPLFLGGAKYG